MSRATNHHISAAQTNNINRAKRKNEIKIKFLPDRALLLQDGKFNITPAPKARRGITRTLVVADIHLGLELELARKGIIIPNQLPLLEKRIDKLLNQTKAKQIVLLGDIKHETASVSWLELRDVPEFLRRLKRKAKVIIVKGNHDGGIESIVPEGVEVHEPCGFVLGDILLTHGQAWPDITPATRARRAKTLIMGHIHPAVEFWSSGVRQKEHIFLRAKIRKSVLEKKFKTKTDLEKVIILPVFNLLPGGIAFNSKNFRPRGPLLEKVIDWKNSEVWLLDGTYLGKLNKIKSKE